ncbi:hypothetical protein ACQKWADRAFT_121325 [Trichoderma austrokoningii]
MGYSPSPRRRFSGDPPPQRYRDFSNERLSPERQFRLSRRGTESNEDDFDVSYGGEPVLAHTASWELPRPTTESYEILNTPPRVLSPTNNSTEKVTSSLPDFVEGVENDGKKAEAVEEAGLSWTVALPTNNEQSMPYTFTPDPNSAWKAKKYENKKIGTTTLESIYAIKYSTGEMGQERITLFCPQGPIRDGEDSASMQAKWLHVQRSSMSIKVLEKLVMDCPIINADVRRVAILLLESVEKSYLRKSENGAYIEPGSVLRFTGTRHVLHDSHNFVVTEPVIFVAFPFAELDSSNNKYGSREGDDFYPRTLLQNLYGFDVVTSRSKNQVIHKMPVNCQPDDTLFVNQLWCLVIGSDILITLSDRPGDDLLGDTIEKRTDYFTQPLRIEIVDVNGLQHSMSISSKTPWVDFFRHVIYTVHGNLISIMDYELVDQADEVVTSERWAKLAKATRFSLLKFHLVERKGPASRSSSVSSRRSSRSGIKRLLRLTYAHHDNDRSSKTSASRYHADKYDGDSSSSEIISSSRRASTPRRFGNLRSLAQRHIRTARKQDQQFGAQAEFSSPTGVTLDVNEEYYPETRGISPSSQTIPNVGGSSKGASDQNVSSLHNVVQQPPEHPRLPSSGSANEEICDSDHWSKYGYSLMREHQDPASSFEEQRDTATSLEDNFFYVGDDDENKSSKQGALDVQMVKDTATSTEKIGTQTSDEGLHEYKETPRSQSNTTATIDRKVQIEDGSESSDGDEIDKDTYKNLTGATLPDPRTELKPDGNKLLHDGHNSYPDNSLELGHREKPRNSTSFSRKVPYERYRSRSSSLSNEIDDFFHSRGRSRIRRQHTWSRETPSLAHSSPSRPAVHFKPQGRNSNKDSAEMSPYGSSNATHVETRPMQTAVPFFFWKQNSMTSTFSSHDTAEQVLIKLLDQIDERISGDPISRYYLKVPELTMDDVLLRQESLHERNLENDPAMEAKAPARGGRITPNNATNASPGRDAHEQTHFSQTQTLSLASHNKTLAKQLVETSQQIISSFIPATGGSVIHSLLKRLWGCVDIICLQLLWEENERRRDFECRYIIRNFTSHVKQTGLQRRKPTPGKIPYSVCEDCKAAKHYQSAMGALDHLHEKHIECKHSDSERPYDDPCYIWLQRIWHNGYPMRSSRDGLLGIMEDFIEELSYISNYVRELHNMTTRDPSEDNAAKTPPLSTNITHAFQQIVKMFVFRSKQLSLINRRGSLISGSALENFPLIQRIDRKIEELFSLEMDANERIIDRLESAKKDVFLSGIDSHSEMLEAETVRVQFLALAFISGIQRPLLQPSAMNRAHVKDTLLQVYKDYTSRLHFQANNRPRKRVFLDIHGLEEELQALEKLVDSQERCLYNVLTLIDPLTSRYTTETRIREFRVEVQYGNDQLHQIIERRREIDNLATRLWILKDQVKQTIEIMEEDHGKAIRVFTVVTLFFLPLSFVSSFLGMNTADVRDSEWNQVIFWITAVPITVGVLSLAFIYGYKGEEIRDWMIQILQSSSHQVPPSTFYGTHGRTSLETRRPGYNPDIATDQNTIGEKRNFKAFVRSKIKNVPGWGRHMDGAFGTFKVSDKLDGRISMRRRNTDDSLAPMRH